MHPVRLLIRKGLAETADRLNTIDPQLATQFLDTNFLTANLADRFLLSSWGTLSARMRPLVTETVVRTPFQPVDSDPQTVLHTSVSDGNAYPTCPFHGGIEWHSERRARQDSPKIPAEKALQRAGFQPRRAAGGARRRNADHCY
jgi:hypothetical protein